MSARLSGATRRSKSWTRSRACSGRGWRRPKASVPLRRCADRFELRLEERLVDLALIDRDTLLDAELDHFGPLDAELLRELLWRQVVCHLAPFPGIKKPAALSAPTG